MRTGCVKPPNTNENNDNEISLIEILISTETKLIYYVSLENNEMYIVNLPKAMGKQCQNQKLLIMHTVGYCVVISWYILQTNISCYVMIPSFKGNASC